MAITASDSPNTTVRPAWPALTVLAGATLLASLGISIASVAMPTLAQAFSVSIPAVQWVALVYLVSVTTAIVTAGWLGDLLGHRRLLIVGFGIFAGASMLCAAAPTLTVLIAGRAVQGVGGAILMALPISMARESVARDRVGSAMGLLGTMSAIGTALGPSLGGTMIAIFGWRSAFWLLAAVGATLAGICLAAMPTTVSGMKASRDGWDWPGALLFAVALLGYAAAMAGLDSRIMPPLAVAAIIAFVVVESRAASPLVPLSLLADRATSTALGLNVIVATVMMSTLVVGPFYLSLGAHLEVAMVGIVMAFGPVVAAFSGVPAGRATDRFGSRRVLLAGLVLIVVGLLGLAMLPRLFGVAGYVGALALLTPGFQMFLAANNTAAMATVPEERRGTMSALLGLSRNLGFMTGASAMAALFAMAAGTGAAKELSAAAVADAFTSTFLLAAGLTMLALVLALFSRGGTEV